MEKILYLLKKLKHPKDINNLKKFIQSGGKFTQCFDKNYVGRYDPLTNKISINIDKLERSGCKNDYNESTLMLIHELRHFEDFNNLENQNLSIYQYYFNFNEQSIQKIKIALEISAFFQETISVIETGGKIWSYFSKIHPQTAKSLGNILKIGEEVNQQKQMAVADTVTTDFCLNLYSNNHFDTYKNIYQTNVIDKLLIKKTDTHNASVNIKEIMKAIGIKTSFTEQQLEALMLLNKDSLCFYDKVRVKTLPLSFSKITNRNKANVARALLYKRIKSFENF